MICNSAIGHHAASLCYPWLIALSGGSQKKHMFLFFSGDKSAFERHRIITNPERGIAIPSAWPDKNSSCIIGAIFPGNHLSGKDPGAVDNFSGNIFKKVEIAIGKNISSFFILLWLCNRFE